MRLAKERADLVDLGAGLGAEPLERAEELGEIDHSATRLDAPALRRGRRHVLDMHVQQPVDRPLSGHPERRDFSGRRRHDQRPAAVERN